MEVDVTREKKWFKRVDVTVDLLMMLHATHNNQRSALQQVTGYIYRLLYS